MYCYKWTEDQIHQSKSKIEVDCADDVLSENLDLHLRQDRANNDSKSHVLGTFVQDTVLGNLFAQYYSILTKSQWNRYCYPIFR